MPCLSELVIDCIICGVQQKCSKVNMSDVNSKWPIYFCELLGIEGENLHSSLEDGFYCPHCYSKIKTVATVSDLMAKMIVTMQEMKIKLDDELYMGNVHLPTISEDDPETVEKTQNKLRVELFRAYEKKLEREKIAAIPVPVEPPKVTVDEETQCMIVPSLPEPTGESNSQKEGNSSSESSSQSPSQNQPTTSTKGNDGKKHLVKIRLPHNITKQVLDTLVAQSQGSNEESHLIIQGFVERSSPTPTVTEGEIEYRSNHELIELEGLSGLTLALPEIKTGSRTKKSDIDVDEDAPFCNICKKVFTSIGYLRRHARQHENLDNSKTEQSPITKSTENGTNEDDETRTSEVTPLPGKIKPTRKRKLDSKLDTNSTSTPSMGDVENVPSTRKTRSPRVDSKKKTVESNVNKMDKKQSLADSQIVDNVAMEVVVDTPLTEDSPTKPVVATPVQRDVENTPSPRKVKSSRIDESKNKNLGSQQNNEGKVTRKSRARITVASAETQTVVTTKRITRAVENVGKSVEDVEMTSPLKTASNVNQQSAESLSAASPIGTRKSTRVRKPIS